MNYVTKFTKQLHELYNAFNLIKLYPEDRNNYLYLYTTYKQSILYLTHKREFQNILIGTLGPFDILDTVYDLKTESHTISIQYQNEEVNISSNKKFPVFKTSFKNKFKKNYLHTFQGSNTKNFETNINDFVNRRN